MLSFSRLQFPVGHGFFHFGKVEVDQTQCRYIYDCGSRSTSVLKNQVARFLDEGEQDHDIDALFISHFHKDHVYGLDQLLSGVRVKTAIIPYLTKIDRLSLIAEGVNAGGMSFTELQFIADPTQWLGDRGVKQVVTVVPDKPTKLKTKRRPVDTSPSENKPFAINFDALPASSENTPVTVRLWNHAQSISLRSPPDAQERWEFRTFVNPEPMRTTAFRAELTNVLHGLALDNATIQWNTDALIDVLRSATQRRELRDLYQRHFERLNATSMSLYAGPSPGFGVATETEVSGVLWSTYRSRRARSKATKRFEPATRKYLNVDGARAGWLGTGDAEIATQARWNSFYHHYEAYFAYTGTMSVPHHGSELNFHRKLLTLGIPAFVASGRMRSSHHPNPSVMKQISRSGSSAFLVCEDPTSTFDEDGEVNAE